VTADLAGSVLSMRTLMAWAPDGFPDVRPGADLPALVVEILRAHGLRPQEGDVVVVAQKVVSKAEGSVVNLDAVTPGPQARTLGAVARKDPRLCQVILDESRAVLRVRPGLIICEHRLGYICANAGVDHSNVGLGPQWVTTLPRDPDASAAAIREALARAFGAPVGVVVNDTHGRAFREGAVGVAIGVAGLDPLYSYVGVEDRYGYVLQTSVEAVADELAGVASLLQGQAAEGRPVVVIRGGRVQAGAGSGARLVRPPERDLFR
jgi:coenzyme F420-0:L-glutamate ligase/coenzyme F420-1:gamma-L-glutamate ligase